MATMKSSPSPYYPPRATPWSRFRSGVNRQVIRLRASGIDYGVTEEIGMFFKGIPWLLIPGLMWRQTGRKPLGNPVMAIWGVTVAVYIVSLNMAFANLAATIASTIHAISASAVFVVLCPHWYGTSRIVRTVVYTLLLVLLIYSVGLRNLVTPFAQRITSGGSTVMIHPTGWLSGPSWKQGEWVAYRFGTGATNFDRILAVPGDTIRFHRDSFEVNGRHFARLSELMPTDGEWTMPPGTYFIWPTVVTFHGDVSEMLLRFAEVTEGDIIGKPYRWWFGMSPDLEPLKPISNTPNAPPP